MNVPPSTVSMKMYNVRLWKMFTDFFNCLPVAASIDDRILCMHEWYLSRADKFGLDQKCFTPNGYIPDSGLICDFTLVGS